MDSELVDQFIEAPLEKTRARTEPIQWVVMHTAECCGASANGAENLARYQARTNRQVSWHYNVDSDSVVQSHEESRVCWHAGNRYVNDRSIGIEMSTYAATTREQWATGDHATMLMRAASLVADICDRNGIPDRWLRSDQLQNDSWGICGHNDVRLGFGTTTHTDPGVGFPTDLFVEVVRDFSKDYAQTVEESDPWDGLPIRFGDTGDLVEEFQEMMNIRYNSRLDTDGDFGPLTRAATDLALRRRNNPSVVDADTWIYLFGL